MIDVIVDQRSLGFSDRFLDGVKLLGQIETRAALTEHLDDPAEMSFGATKPLDDIRMRFVDVIFCHLANLSSLGG